MQPHYINQLSPCFAYSHTALDTTFFQALALTHGVDDNRTAASSNHINQVPLHLHHWPRPRPLFDNSSCSCGTCMFCSGNSDSKCCIGLRGATTEYTFFNIIQWDRFVVCSYDIIDCNSQIISYDRNFSLLYMWE